MSSLVPLPAKGAGLPQGIDPSRDQCDECGDFLCWCPIWCQRWPELQHHREEDLWTISSGGT